MSNIGNIARLEISEFTKENLPTGVTRSSGQVRLCEKISPSYPVSEAIVQSSHLVDSDSIALILSKEGRPTSFQSGEGWSCYDIFNILVEGRTYQCFRYSLKILA